MTDPLLTPEGQKIFKDNSKWMLLDKYHEAKRRYYKGLHSITDQEFDALERSISVIHGEELLEEYGHVGYSKELHDKIKSNLEESEMKTLELHKRRIDEEK